MARNDPQVNFRIPVALKTELEAAAAKNNRSFKAELEYRLAGWDDAIDQLSLTQEGLESAKVAAELHKQNSEALAEELRLARFAFDNLKSRHEEQKEEFASRLAMAQMEVLPHSLRKRIERRAQETGRTSEEEITLALEQAFPPTATARLLNLEMLALHWRGQAWRLVDWDTWGRFLSGDNSTHVTKSCDEGLNHFVVLVVDEHEGLQNIVPHSYRITKDGYRSATLELLSQSEIRELNALMTTAIHTKDDESRLADLQNKMAPALSLPALSIPPLREALGQIAPMDIVDRLLRARGMDIG